MSESFKPDYSEKQFSIVIDAYDNGLTFTVKGVKQEPKYYEVIGAIHQMLYSVMEKQRQESVNEFEKQSNANKRSRK